MNVMLANTRTPSEAQPPRMEPLARLPVFFALDGQARGRRRRQRRPRPGRRSCCRRQARRSMSTRPSRARRCWRSRPIRRSGAIVIHRRAWTPTIFAGAAHRRRRVRRRRRGRALRRRRARAPACRSTSIDKPAFCDFSFGAIVNRSPLVIGISTDGAAPVFGQAIRAKLEALIPRGFARWAEAARRWRSAVQGIRPVVRRPAPLLAAVHRACGRAIPTASRRRPTSTGCWRETRRRRSASSAGSVTLVGAGPGDPELLTLRAVRALQSADVILFDDLVSPEILDFARREAKKMLVGKTGHGPSCKQDEINALMVGARQGRQARGAAQGRRPDDLRPRRRGDRGLPRRGHCRRGRARHHRRRRARQRGSAFR